MVSYADDQHPYFVRFKPDTKQVFPVIHALNDEQVLENARIAFDVGVDGIFLIQMQAKNDDLLGMYRNLRQEYPDAFIGLNLLNASLTDIISRELLPVDASALWLDNAWVGTKTSEANWQNFIKTYPGVFLFGGIYFKYTDEENETVSPDKVKMGTKVTHGLVTSGAATGSPPSIEKVASIVKAADGHPVGIASGTNHENISQFSANFFLVATSIEGKPDSFDPRKLEQYFNCRKR